MTSSFNTALTDSAPSARDHIFGFASGDQIDVPAIDANAAEPGNQAFEVDDAVHGDFTFGPGEIRQVVSGSDLRLDFNVDADSTPEMQILIIGRTAFFSPGDGNFIL